MRRNARAYIFLALSMTSWGLANPLSDIAMESLTVGEMLLIEVGVGFALISIVAAIQRRKLRIDWRWAIALGLLEPGLTYVFGNIGYASGTVTVGLIIMSSETLILALLGRVILREMISKPEGAAIAVGFSGALLVGWTGAATAAGSVSGSLAFLLAAIAAAGYAIVVRIYTTQQPQADVFALTWAQTLVSLGLGVAAFTMTGSAPAPAAALWAAVGAGVFGVAIPFLLFAKAASAVPARHAAIALNIIPVVGISIGAVLGRGVPTTWQYVGGALVIASLMVLAQREH